jgi:kindlin 2
LKLSTLFSQVSLEGSVINGGRDKTTIPQLADSLRYFRPRRFTLKSFKRLYFVVRDLTLTGYKSSDQARSGRGEAAVNINLKVSSVRKGLVLKNYDLKTN